MAPRAGLRVFVELKRTEAWFSAGCEPCGARRHTSGVRWVGVAEGGVFVRWWGLLSGLLGTGMASVCVAAVQEIVDALDGLRRGELFELVPRD